jgi:hypothetical protein
VWLSENAPIPPSADANVFHALDKLQPSKLLTHRLKTNFLISFSSTANKLYFEGQFKSTKEEDVALISIFSKYQNLQFINRADH